MYYKNLRVGALRRAILTLELLSPKKQAFEILVQ
jgi:hypothetical protein